jgi:hypothetical protein
MGKSVAVQPPESNELVGGDRLATTDFDAFSVSGIHNGATEWRWNLIFIAFSYLLHSIRLGVTRIRGCVEESPFEFR